MEHVTRYEVGIEQNQSSAVTVGTRCQISQVMRIYNNISIHIDIDTYIREYYHTTISACREIGIWRCLLVNNDGSALLSLPYSFESRFRL